MEKKKLKELFWYGVSGITTAVINVGIYYLLLNIGIDYKISNFFAVINSKIYSFFTNKYLVFRTHCSSWQESFYEFFKFSLARGFTGIIDFVGVWLMVGILGMDKMISKYAIQIMVIIINYILGKKIVFRRGKRT